MTDRTITTLLQERLQAMVARDHARTAELERELREVANQAATPDKHAVKRIVTPEVQR